MLLPMLSIYQEYVRNHHYSLQVLTECKQSPAFSALLARLENKPACQGRSLETFLTYPMHQVRIVSQFVSLGVFFCRNRESALVSLFVSGQRIQPKKYTG